MRLRIFFEPNEGIRIDDIKVFEFYGGNYLSDFDVRFGGYISMDVLEKVHGRFEPVWQFIMDDVTEDKKLDLLEYVSHDPMKGYHTHIYQDHSDKKLY